MTCPPEIADIILDILKTAILRTRSFAWSQDHARCAVEADHIHNLPQLLRHFSFDLLHFYWEIERPAYIGRTSADDLAMFEPLWIRLAHYCGKSLHSVS